MSRIYLMPLTGEYEPSTQEWVRNQVALYEESGGKQGNTLRDTGLPVVIVSSRGARSDKVRKSPLMRVEHDGEYLLVASKGGSDEHPSWYYNLKSRPNEVCIQDGDRVLDVSVRELDGEERETWWARAVEAFPAYAEYQAKTRRRIPIFLAASRES